MWIYKIIKISTVKGGFEHKYMADGISKIFGIGPDAVKPLKYQRVAAILRPISYPYWYVQKDPKNRGMKSDTRNAFTNIEISTHFE